MVKLIFKYFPHDNHWSICTWEGGLRSTYTIRKQGINSLYLVRFRAKIIYIAESIMDAKGFIFQNIKDKHYILHKQIIEKCSPYKYTLEAFTPRKVN